MTATQKSYLGVDLGGARGKTTAVALLRAEADHLSVLEVRTRHASGSPWCDDALLDYAGSLPDGAAVAINAPLTVPACVRCQRNRCPGAQLCDDVAVVWLRERGAEMVEVALEQDLDRIAAIPSSTRTVARGSGARTTGSLRLAPYIHRAAEVELCYSRGLLPRDCTGAATGPIAARAAHLCRALISRGFRRDDTLLEVSPRATVHALFGAEMARGYKRDADPWHTRAAIVEGLDGLRFAVTSGLSREEVLRNDHCFEALLSGYTAYLRDRDGWQPPADDVYAEDGIIWAPPVD